LKGKLTSACGNNVQLRLSQYRHHADPKQRLTWARALVEAKLHNAAELVQRFMYNHKVSDLAESAAEVKNSARRAASSNSLEELRGIEGAGTRCYFGALTRMCRGDLAFQGRTRRPPRDPFNALLSFGYVLLTKEITSLLEAAGLDPYIGFYHDSRSNRAALALDLVEEYRHPLIDRFCLTLNNRGVLTGNDFVTGKDGGVRLQKDALKEFLTAYDRWMRTSPREERPTPRTLIRKQVENVLGSLRQGRPYVPYRFES